jgi:hypothetical protein
MREFSAILDVRFAQAMVNQRSLFGAKNLAWESQFLPRFELFIK